MRLTLRTLLAYLDDTLEPGQTRDIGVKLAESDVARELVERIRKVVRKRSLTNPPISGADKADPNVVAEYLDNDLPADKLAEVEEQALHSDVHLAEIAACHQLLSLIVSEPARVPPTARQRMYGLVKGPEADPSRQAPRVAAATMEPVESIPDDENDSPLLSRRGGKKRLIAAGVLSLILLGAVWMVTRPPQQVAGPPLTGQLVAENKVAPNDEAKNVVPKEKANTPPVEKPDEKAAALANDPPKEKAPPSEQPKEKAPPSDQPKATDPPKPQDNVAAELLVARKTSDDRTDVAKYVSTNELLLQSVHDGAEWQRVAPGANITGLTRLHSLPGLTNEVRLGDAVIVEIVGQVPEWQQLPPEIAVREAVVRAFVPPVGFNADLRVERGRVFLRAAKPNGATIRVRLADDIADVKLPDDQSEIVVDQVPGAIGVIKGTAQVQMNRGPETMMKAAPGLALWLTQSGKGWEEKPKELAEPIPFWAKGRNFTGPGREQAQEMDGLVKRVPKLLGDTKKDLKLAISELAYDRSPLGRRLCLYYQAALDDLAPMLDALEDQANPEARISATYSLNHWLQRSADQPAKMQEALVARRGMTALQAERVLALFHGFDEKAQRDPKTYQQIIDGLGDDRLAIRELSFWRLSQVDPEGARTIRYTPTESTDALKRGQQEWRRRIPEGTVPVRPKT